MDPAAFGVCAHVANDNTLRSLAAAGIRWFRIDVEWSEHERTQGSLQWSELDRIVATLKGLGCSILASCAYVPTWASLDGKPSGMPRDLGAWRAFVETAVGRYPQLDAIGIGNEPNLRQFWSGTKAQYLQFLRVGLEAAKAVRPSIITAGPDLSSSPGNDKPTNEWLAPILDSRAGPLLDVVTQHIYDGDKRDLVGSRVRYIDRLHQWLERRGDGRPLWITETGEGDEHQAAYLSGIVAAMRTRPWWAKVFAYDSHSSDFGLLGPDGSTIEGQPRPSLVAYQKAIQEATSWAAYGR